MVDILFTFSDRDYKILESLHMSVKEVVEKQGLAMKTFWGKKQIGKLEVHTLEILVKNPEPRFMKALIPVLAKYPGVHKSATEVRNVKR